MVNSGCTCKHNFIGAKMLPRRLFKFNFDVSTVYLLLILFVQFPGTLTYDPTWWSSIAQLGAHPEPGEVLFDPGSDVLLPDPADPDSQSPDRVRTPERSVCAKLPGLSSGQARICELFFDHMPAVGYGARKAIEECQSQFEYHRWNCSTPAEAETFGPVHVLGTREAAYTYSIIAGGVAHEVGQSCKKGMLSACGCSNHKRPKDLPAHWKWGGCGDNVGYGAEFSRTFIDIREKEKTHPKRSTEHGRALMNRWNSEVGRKLLSRLSDVSCKCHGVSGSCNMKTCWKRLPNVAQIGKNLVEKYNSARKVMINRRGNLQIMPTSGEINARARRRKARGFNANNLDLVYLDDSPDYCKHDKRYGVQGTHGRYCTLKGTGASSCEVLCCGRGYNTFKLVESTKCDCKFEWCCQVVCKTCVTTKNVHVCK